MADWSDLDAGDAARVIRLDTRPNAPRPRLPSRLEVRALVEHQGEQLRAAAHRGIDALEVGRGHRDQVHAFAAALPPDDGAAFLRLWTEETHAWNGRAEAEAARQRQRTGEIEAVRAADAPGDGRVWTWIGLALAVVVLAIALYVLLA